MAIVDIIKINPSETLEAGHRYQLKVGNGELPITSICSEVGTNVHFYYHADENGYVGQNSQGIIVLDIVESISPQDSIYISMIPLSAGEHIIDLSLKHL